VRPFAFVAVLLCAAAVAVPAVAGQGTSAASKTIKVGDNFFKPRSKTFNGATSVTWKWTGHRRHNVHFTKAPRGVKKPRGCGARKSGKCTRKLKKKGTYRYVCVFHGSMTGKVRIR
jgi:plastocyanin